VAEWLVQEGLSSEATALEDARSYLTVDYSQHTAYQANREMIGLLDREGNVRELSETTDSPAVAGLTGFVVKPYVCYPKPVDIDVDAVPEG
jgi:hypothetical protein